MSAIKFFGIGLVVSALLLTASSCKHGIIAVCEFGGDDTFFYGEPATVTLRAEQAICGTGYWENVWLLLPDGANNENGTSERKWLRPFAVSDAVKSSGFKLKEGQVVELTYYKMKSDGRYDKIVSCEAYPGKHENIYVSRIAVRN